MASCGNHQAGIFFHSSFFYLFILYEFYDMLQKYKIYAVQQAVVIIKQVHVTIYFIRFRLFRYKYLVTRGKFPQHLDVWNKYNSGNQSKNKRPDYAEDQLYLIFAQKYKGNPLKQHKIYTVWQAMAIIKQVHSFILSFFIL